mgnify:CR=1 FL=1
MMPHRSPFTTPVTSISLIGAAILTAVLAATSLRAEPETPATPEKSVGVSAETLAEIMLEADGRLTIETAALAALRRLEGEARHDRSRKLRLAVPSEVFAWLDGDAIAWRAALADRIGPRFELVEQADLERDECRVSRA